MSEMGIVRTRAERSSRCCSTCNRERGGKRYKIHILKLSHSAPLVFIVSITVRRMAAVKTTSQGSYFDFSLDTLYHLNVFMASCNNRERKTKILNKISFLCFSLALNFIPFYCTYFLHDDSFLDANSDSQGKTVCGFRAKIFVHFLVIYDIFLVYCAFAIYNRHMGSVFLWA